MITVQAPIGHVDEAPFAGRSTDVLVLDSAEAAKRRLRRRSHRGRDVALDLPRGSFLPAGTVLADLDEEILITARRPERALVVTFSPTIDRELLCRQAITLGHELGNQHVPVEAVGGELRIPVTTSEEVLAGAVRRLGLVGLQMWWADVRLAENHPLGGHGHGHAH